MTNSIDYSTTETPMNTENEDKVISLVPKNTLAQQFVSDISKYLPENYFLDELTSNIVYREWKYSKDRGEYPVDSPICSPLAITALTHSDDGKEGGLFLQWVDRRNKLREWVLPQHMLADDFKSIATNLHRNRIKWLPSEPKNRRFFMDYLCQSMPEKTILYTEKTGWNDGSFVFPEKIVGDKEIVFQSTNSKHMPPKIVGSVEDWKNKIGKWCVGNPTLTLGAAAAFAAPLAGLLGENGFLVHLIGASSRGKTLSLGVQCSVFGMEKGSWRGTDNAKESEFEARNHIGASLDELGQSTPAAAYQIVYMVGNGQGKARANKDGTQQRIRDFNIIALSTGEISLDDFLLLAKKDLTGGLSVRFIQGQSDIYKYGCFDNIYGMKDGGAFARYIGNVTGITGDKYNPECSGAVGVQFIEYLSKTIGDDFDKQCEIKNRINAIASKLTTEDDDAQLERMANSMALLIVAGEIATTAGLTGWDDQTAFNDIARWWRESVLPLRGSSGSTEENKSLEHVKDFFELHHMSHFTPLGVGDCQQPQKSNFHHYGYVETVNGETTYYVTSAGWKEICAGRNPKQVAQYCIKDGLMMEHEVKGKMEIYKNKKIMGKSSQFYWLRF